MRRPRRSAASRANGRCRPPGVSVVIVSSEGSTRRNAPVAVIGAGLDLGGGHSIAIGTLGGMANADGPGGVLWIDAHGDLNRPQTSPTGNVHGMPLAAALGVATAAFESDAWPTPSVARAALVGTRSLDRGEREILADLDVRVFTMSEIDRAGVEHALREALDFLRGSPFVHVSLDLDPVDP